MRRLLIMMNQNNYSDKGFKEIPGSFQEAFAYDS